MDGNGRWAAARSKPRIFGHKNGAKRVSEITKAAKELGVEVLSLYAFSTENWSRPNAEVAYLKELLGDFLKKQKANFLKEKIIFRAIGDLERFGADLCTQIRALELDSIKNIYGDLDSIESTCGADFSLSNFSSAFSGAANFKKDVIESKKPMIQVLALNYGSCDEILRAFNRILGDFVSLDSMQKQKSIESKITREILENALDTAGLPPVDMLVRTGGEQRLSNFLLYQCAYAELFFTKTLWPDFSADELEKLVAEFYERNRRFGGV